MKNYLDLCIVSNATLRTQDLYSAFFSFIASIDWLFQDFKDEYEDDPIYVLYKLHRSGYLTEMIENNMLDKDTESWYLNQTLLDFINSHCPPYTEFGASEGDGACFGVWVSYEAIEDAIKFNEVEIYIDDDGEEEDLPDNFTGLVVNSDYEPSVYYENGIEVWRV